ncbi:MAG TPA: N-acetyl-gamma-glutamyl-phosphate reductase [Methanocorpusculum sp.]|nr:N-acetyl-gamma-glutamyl-phosphate reductase [Methanocorpusculum sp.]
MDIAIIGASGYTGGDLIRLLLTHKEVNIVCATSRKLCGKKVAEDHVQLNHLIDLEYTNPDIDNIDADFAFLAVPHTAAMQYAGALKSRGIKAVDLSADYRLPQDVYEKTYGVKHTAYFKAPYGLPELHRKEIRNAEFTANPGCFPTGATLSAAPVAKLAETIIYDSKSGVSGAGDSVSETTHYPNVDENISPYKITVHRHIPEMRQEASFLGSKANVYFTPHLLPAIRGIITTAHILFKEPQNPETIAKLYADFYKDEHFIRLQKAKLGGVRGSNFCDINWELEADGRRLVAVSAIDNLVKGAAGQAVQNMNIMCGFEETEGLRMPGMFP